MRQMAETTSAPRPLPQHTRPETSRRHRGLGLQLGVLGGGPESQVIPPPVPYIAARVSRSISTVRMGALKRARNGAVAEATIPAAPQ